MGPFNKYAMNVGLSSLRIRAHLSWRTGKHLHVLNVLRTYSTCSYPGYQDTTTYAALTLAYSGILWHTLAYSGILWHTLAYSGKLWQTLAYSGILWHTLAYSSILWHTLA